MNKCEGPPPLKSISISLIVTSLGCLSFTVQKDVVKFLTRKTFVYALIVAVSMRGGE